MLSANIAELPDRGVVRLLGVDAAKLLQGLITNDIDRIGGAGDAIHAALLSPQGKILFDFFVVGADGGFLVDISRATAVDFVKRLAMYKLRADARIEDVSDKFRTFAIWGDAAQSPVDAMGSIFADPRSELLGRRIVADVTMLMPKPNAPASAYHALRIALGVPEGGADYEFGDAVPHEADFDLLNGVSFTKGCFVGQEVVARMQNKSVVRKRIVRIAGDSSLTSGEDVLLGDVPIGKVGSANGADALAMLRLDRAVEAEAKGIRLTAGGVAITPDAEALARYIASAAARPAAAGLIT